MRFPLFIVAVALFVGVAGCSRSHDEALANLSSPDPTVRSQAVNRLGLIGDSSDLGDIVARVSDPDPLVRSAAAAALGHFDDRRAADALGELVAPDGNEAVQVVAVRSLARLSVERAHAYLLLAYRRDGSAVRAAVAEELDRRQGSATEVVRAEAKALWDELSAALTRGGTAERVAAAEELGRSGRPEAIDRLAVYLGAESHALAASAAEGLGESGQPAARAPLELMLAEEDPELAIAAAQALGELGSPASAAPLAKIVSRGGRVGEAALAALASLGAAARAQLCGAALGPDPSLAAEAAAAVHAQGGACDLAPFVGALQRSSTQAAALAALAALGGPAPEGGARRIGSLLEAGPSAVRPYAARAAGALGLSELAPALQRAVTEVGGRLASGRARWIATPLPKTFQAGFQPADGATSRDYRARVDTLMSKLAAHGIHVSDDEPDEPLFGDEVADDLRLYGEAVAALARLAAPGAGPLVATAAHDGSAAIRALACEAAAALPAPAGLEPLEALARDPDLAVRARALGLLPAAVAKASPTERAAVRKLVADELASSDGSEDPVLIDVLGELGQGEGSASIDALTEALNHPGTAGRAIRALGRFGTVQAKELLLARLKRGAAAGLPELVRTIAELKLSEAAPSIRPLLFHARPSVRAAAAQASIQLGDPAAAKDVAALREDFYASVREAAGGPAPSAAPAPMLAKP